MSFITPVSLESFQLAGASQKDALVLSLTGTGDMLAIEPLKAALKEARAGMIRSGLARLRVNIQGLYLLNSSCIKALVHFVYLTQTEGPAFQIEFLTDKNLSWQGRALAPLGRMAPTLVTVTAT
jgi:hypothetical protein